MKEKFMYRHFLLILLLISFIPACTSVDYSRRTEADLPPVYEPRNAQQQAPQVQAQPKVITTAKVDNTRLAKVNKKPAVPASRAAVLDLLAQSKSAIEQYKYDEAESLLKRALRIEPGNAWLWHNMAVIKFYQEDYQQAIQQAMKSNNLSKNNEQLDIANGKIIKQSYTELDKSENAR